MKHWISASAARSRPVVLLCAAFAALAAGRRADGNVIAFVDGQGELRLVGDAQHNSIRLEATDLPDRFEVIGFDSTTVNGQDRMILFAPGPRIIVMLGERGRQHGVLGRRDRWRGDVLQSPPARRRRVG